MQVTPTQILNIHGLDAFDIERWLTEVLGVREAEDLLYLDANDVLFKFPELKVVPARKLVERIHRSIQSGEFDLSGCNDPIDGKPLVEGINPCSMIDWNGVPKGRLVLMAYAVDRGMTYSRLENARDRTWAETMRLMVDELSEPEADLPQFWVDIKALLAEAEQRTPGMRQALIERIQPSVPGSGEVPQSAVKAWVPLSQT